MRKSRSPQRDSRGIHRRLVNIRPVLNRFLIVCEGERTEPNYFRQFRVPREVAIVNIHGTGYNTESLVREAMRLREEKKYDGEDDQVWCVFDRDSFLKAQFNRSLRTLVLASFQLYACRYYACRVY